MRHINKSLEDVKVSIIVPSFNSEIFISQCISSVINQSHDNWELLIVDGESGDGTQEIIKKAIALDSRIRLINNPDDNGPAQARAYGVRFCSGDLIAFLDSDDLWLPSKLEEQITFMMDNNAKFSFTGYRLISESGILSNAELNGWKVNTYKQYLRRRGIANSTVIVSKECLSDSILNSVTNTLAEDTLWWLLIMKSGYKAFCLQKPLTHYRKVSGSRSSMILENQIAVWNLYRNNLKLGRLQTSFYYLFYLIDVLLRRIKFIIDNRVRT